MYAHIFECIVPRFERIRRCGLAQVGAAFLEVGFVVEGFKNLH